MTDEQGMDPSSLAEQYRLILAQFGGRTKYALDIFEDARFEGETRAQAKTRIMLEEYRRRGFEVKDRDLYNLRRRYLWIRSYVQGRGGGLPYSTDNMAHFTNRYAMGGLQREPELMIGLFKETPTLMAQAVARAEAEREMARLMYGSWFAQVYRVLSGRAYG